MSKMPERVEPIRLTDKRDNKKYTLEFSRSTVVRINKLGFKRSELFDNVEEMLPLLWYGAFMMHHDNVNKRKTDDILINGMGGMTSAVAERLIALYEAPATTLLRDEEDADEGDEKNSQVAVEL